MRYTLPLLACGLLTFSSLVLALDPLAIGYNLDTRGAPSVVAELARNGQLQEVEESVRLGDDSWIALVPKLIAGGHAQFTAELKTALSAALIYNPAAVLTTIGKSHDLHINEICRTPPGADSRFQQQAQHTLSTLRNADLLNQRDACLTALQQ